ANEQVIGGRCERCDTPVEKRQMTQWFYRITKYADELLRFEGLDWPERVRVLQTNWIGRSEGAEITFPVEGHPGADIKFFTTRPDTIYGATFMVLAPEHPLVERITTPAQREQVRKYVDHARNMAEIERTTAEREKTGIFTGAYAKNVFTGERVPIWIADYVLLAYGTGAIMAVPAHDERDFAFAKKFGLEIREVISEDGREHGAPRHGHDGHVRRFVLVHVSLRRSEDRHGVHERGDRQEVAARPSVHRWRRARHPAPALHALHGEGAA